MVDKKADLAGTEIGDYDEIEKILPQDYESIHHGNTEKVARAIAEVLGVDLKKISKVEAKELIKYDLIGLFWIRNILWKTSQKNL